MTGSRRAMVLTIGLLAMFLGGAAKAQDLSAGKTPAQLFHSNCAMCHKSPRGLAAAGEKAGGLFGLENFLAQHYTASGRSAAMIADYLKSVDKGSAPQRRSRPHRTATSPRKPAAKTDAAKKDAAKKDGKPAKMTDEKSAAPTSEKSAADKPKADKPKMADPKRAEKKPAAQDEAKRGKPKPTQKNTD